MDKSYRGMQMHCLRLMRQHKVVVTVHHARVLLLIGFWWFCLEAKHCADVFLPLWNGEVVPAKSVNDGRKMHSLVIHTILVF